MFRNGPGKEAKSARLGSVAAIALALTACGGGGGGVNFLPPPPPTPTPTPTPTSTPAPPGFVREPLQAVSGSAAPVLATGAASFSAGAAEGTEFPLLQTGVEEWGNGIFPVTSDGAAVIHEGKLEAVEGNTEVWNDNLDWTRMGYWWLPTDWFSVPNTTAVFVAGYQTPAAAVPTTGSATYSGEATGWIFWSMDQDTFVSGKSALTANFGARTLTGSLTDMVADGQPWNSVAFTSTITGNAFTGTTSVTSAPGGAVSLAGSATGTLDGRFFGPSAQEAGAVWTLFDGTRAAIGTLSASRNDACSGCWDY